MTTVIVLGSTGMLGQSCARRFKGTSLIRLIPTQRRDRYADNWFDAGDSPDALLSQHPGAYVINCIGVLAAEFNSGDPGSLRRGISLNALFPHDLARSAERYGNRVVHVSSDGVFAGTSTMPYDERSPTDASESYGKAKALGEPVSQSVVSIRCSFIGLDSFVRKGLVEWFLGMPNNSTISGFTDQLWSGVTTYQFADLCSRIIAADAFDNLRHLSPVHHFCPNPPLTKYELLVRLNNVAGKQIEISPAGSGPNPINRRLISCYNALGAIYPNCDDWDNTLATMLAEGNN